LRDAYRAYFEKQGCTPIAEMYWVVVRYGVKDGIARQTLMVARRKGLNVTTWQECYTLPGRISLEDGSVRTLRREVTKAIHNAAKKAAYQLRKVWSSKLRSVAAPN